MDLREIEDAYNSAVALGACDLANAFARVWLDKLQFGPRLNQSRDAPSNRDVTEMRTRETAQTQNEMS